MIEPCKPCDCGGDCAEQKPMNVGTPVGCPRCDEIAVNILSSVACLPPKVGCVHCEWIEQIVLGPAPVARAVAAPEPMPTVIPVPRFVMVPLEMFQRGVFAVLKKLNIRVE